MNRSNIFKMHLTCVPRDPNAVVAAVEKVVDVQQHAPTPGPTQNNLGHKASPISLNEFLAKYTSSDVIPE